MAKFTDIRIISIVGGDPIEAQFEALAAHPDIIVATPGRLMHHIREIPTFKLSACRYLVFDEADRLFEMGFAEQLNEIVRECPEERQTLLFSATMPKQLVQFSRAGLRDPQLVRLETDAKMSDELRIANVYVRFYVQDAGGASSAVAGASAKAGAAPAASAPPSAAVTVTATPDVFVTRKRSTTPRGCAPSMSVSCSSHSSCWTTSTPWKT
jgi:ribosome-binding factor A